MQLFRVYLKFTSKAFDYFQFIGIKLVVTMENANFNDDLYDVFHQPFGIFFVSSLQMNKKHEMKNTQFISDTKAPKTSNNNGWWNLHVTLPIDRCYRAARLLYRQWMFLQPFLWPSAREFSSVLVAQYLELEMHSPSWLKKINEQTLIERTNESTELNCTEVKN